MSAGMTSKASSTLLATGTGILRVLASQSLHTTNQLLTVTTDDVDFLANSEVSTGTGAMTLNCHTAGRVIGIGGYVKQMTLSGAELQYIHSEGLTIGGEICGKQTVNGITKDHGQFLSGIVSLHAVRDGANIDFSGTSSTFVSMHAQADSGIALLVDLSTTTGEL